MVRMTTTRRGGRREICEPVDLSDRTRLGVLFSDTHQCFGSWHGTVRLAGTVLDVDGTPGWAEQVRNRW